MPCRTERIFEIRQNSYGYAMALLNVPDEGQGWHANFVTCWKCRAHFVAVWPEGLKVFPCIECLEDVWLKKRTA